MFHQITRGRGPCFGLRLGAAHGDTARFDFSFRVPHTLRGWSSKGNCIYADPPLELLAGLNSAQIKSGKLMAQFPDNQVML